MQRDAMVELQDRPSGRRRPWAWWLARGVLFASGVSLFAYLGYRYSLGSVPDHGSLYGVLFPLSSILALGALAMAFRPHLLDRITGLAGPAAKTGVVVLGAGWMATGLLCIRSLTAGVIAAPFGGTLDLTHMLSHHVVIPVGLGFLALGSRRVEAWFVGAPAVEEPDGPASRKDAREKARLGGTRGG